MYRFYLGPAGEQKQKKLLQSIKMKISETEGVMPDIFFIVPEQMNRQVQDAISFEGLDHAAAAFSFKSLAKLIAKETGMQEKVMLDDIGKSIILRKIIRMEKGNLPVLSSASENSGMLDAVRSMITECIEYGVGPEDLEKLAGSAGKIGRHALEAKLLDTADIYRKFRKFTDEKYITMEDTEDILARNITNSRMLSGSIIIFDGFTGFTPPQYDVIRGLMLTAKEIIFLADAGVGDGGPPVSEAGNTGKCGNSGLLFYMTRKMIQEITKRAALVGCLHGEDIYESAAARPADLLFLSNNCFRIRRSTFQGPAEHIRIFHEKTPGKEAETVCRTIRQMVMEYGYRYHEFAIVTGGCDKYTPFLMKYAKKYSIPVFGDNIAALSDCLLFDMISAAADIFMYDFSRRSVFRYLRSGMSSIPMEDIDLLENIVLKKGISGEKKWKKPFDENTEDARKAFLAEISPLSEAVQKAKENKKVLSVTEWATAFYYFLKNNNTYEKLCECASLFKMTNPVKGKLYKEAYKSSLQVLEKICALDAEEKTTLDEFVSMYLAGMQSVHIGYIQENADSVLIGDITRTRLPEIKVLFIMGANDGIIPKRSAGGGILSDTDRERIEETGIVMAPSPRQRMYDQQFYLYRLFSQPSDQLFISYAETGMDARMLQPSYIISKISAMFPKAEPGSALGSGLPLSRKDEKAFLAFSMRKYADGRIEEWSEEEKKLFNLLSLYHEESDTRMFAERITAAAFKKYKPRRILPETAAALFGTSISGSVTRMETAAGCMARHFLTYGMHLKEREIYEVKPADAGNIMHSTMEIIGRSMKQDGISWVDVSDIQCEKYVKDAFEKVILQYRDLLWKNNARDEYESGRICKMLLSSVKAVRYQLQQGKFLPYDYEKHFDREINFDLGAGRSILLSGSVDRLDTYDDGQNLYFKIVDYKSGKHQLDKEAVRAGLQLQLIMYAQVCRKILEEKTKKRALPAAMLYLQLKDPLVDGHDDAEKIQEEKRESFRPDGMASEDTAAARALDEYTGGGKRKKSLVMPASFKGIGERNGVRKSSHTYTQEEYESLVQCAEEKIILLGHEILDGIVDTSPVEENKSAKTGEKITSCTYCPYKDACGFDRHMCSFRKITQD